MPINVLAFAGSPRRHGNSETLLDWVLASMGEDPDVTIDKIALTEANINPCRGCNACEKLNKCVQRDGMDIVHDKIIAADCILISSPIFCLGLCAQVKALVDRAQVFRSRKYVLKLPVVPRNGKASASAYSSQLRDRNGIMSLMLPCHRSSASIM